MNVGSSKEFVTQLDSKVQKVLSKLKKCDNDDIQDLLNQIMGNEDEDDIEQDGSIRSLNRANSLNVSERNMSGHISVLGPEGSQVNTSGNVSARMTKMLQNNAKKEKRAKNIKVKNRRSKDSVGYGKAWSYYVSKICTSRYVRDLSNEEQNSVAQFIYESLTKNTVDESEKLNVFSLKKFIANSIDYACDCEKETWTVYLVIFIFKMLGTVLKI